MRIPQFCCGTAALLATMAVPTSAAELANAQLKDASGKAIGDVDLVQTPAASCSRSRSRGCRPASARSTSMRSANAKRRSNRPVRISIPASTSTA